jgi:hypothetical protein
MQPTSIAAAIIHDWFGKPGPMQYWLLETSLIAKVFINFEPMCVIRINFKSLPGEFGQYSCRPFSNGDENELPDIQNFPGYHLRRQAQHLRLVDALHLAHRNRQFFIGQVLEVRPLK